MPDIILDASTPKDSIIIKFLVDRLEKDGISYIVVARSSTQTIDLLEMFGIDYVLTGRYGYTLEDKYRVTLEQEMILAKVFASEKPSLVWSHGNVAVVRTAYQLGIPVILSNDTPHNKPVVKLTTPLATKLISPEAIEKCVWVENGIEPENVVIYSGVEEYTWTRLYRDVDREEILKKYLGYVPDRVIVYRGVEYKASYSYQVETPSREIVERVSRYGTVIVVPRYGDEKRVFQGIENVVILDKTPLAVELLAASDMAVLSGGTMAKEAALLGIPTISFYFRDKVLTYLMSRGLPIRYIPHPDMIEEYVSLVLEEPDKFRIYPERLIGDFQDHIDVIIDTVYSLLKR